MQMGVDSTDGGVDLLLPLPATKTVFKPVRVGGAADAVDGNDSEFRLLTEMTVNSVDY